MSRIRIYELAKELNIPSKKLVDALADLNLNVQNHMSSIDGAVADIIRDVLRPARGKKAASSNAEPAATGETAEPPAVGRDASKPPAVDRQPSKPSGRQPAQDKQVKPEPPRRPAKGEKGSRPASPAAKATARPAAETIDDEDVDPELVARSAEDRKRPRRSPAASGRSDSQNRRSGDSRSKAAKGRQPRRNDSPRPEAPSVVKLDAEDITVGDLASKLKRPATDLIRKLVELGVMAAINQTIDFDTAALVATELGFVVEQAAPKEPVYENPFEAPPKPDDPSQLFPRPPVVTVMGHVDHGKTSLLDAIRQTKVTAQEAGGITQHIGAYQVECMGQLITFLDTPGHEAFTAMRARGAKATDIAVLVVAADDGIMPQTVEAISHAKAAEVPIIVALNKVDKPSANPERVKQQLPEHGLVPEEWGGDTICVNVSALQRQGIDDLLTSILTLAELAEFKANPNKPARGIVIESKIDKGRGPVATVLVNEGTLTVGDAVLAGTTSGRIRAMTNDRGRRMKSAGPSAPVEIIGLSDAPGAGDPFMVLEDEKTARGYAEKLRDQKRQAEMKTVQRVSLDDLFSQIAQGEVKELRIVLKADVQGSVEALRQSLVKLSNDEVSVVVIHDGVGPVNESDILLASASEAIIIGFNVRPDSSTRKAAEQHNVDIRLYRVIYDAIEDVEKAIKGLLAPVFKEVVLGQAEVRQVFKVSRVGTIAGCYLTEGKVTRQSKARLLRGGVVVFEGEIESLKRFKDDVREVAAGYECGIGLAGFNDIKEGDVIEAYIIEQVEQK
ncbi:MAG: translation initiation factor IF-2 [Bacillota bacterium]|jgi:translation initiation factor IF-2